MRLLLALFGLSFFCITGCSPNPDLKTILAKKHTQGAQLQQQVYPENAPLALPGNLDKAKSLKHILAVDRVIRLEMTDASLVGEVTDFLFHHNAWYVLDAMMGRVHIFEADGRFRKSFGRRGHGPAEWQQPKAVRVCFNDQIGVTDIASGKILLFSDQGEFQRQIAPRLGNHPLYPRYQFAWEQPDQLVLIAYGQRRHDLLQHVILDASQRNIELKHSFGEPIPAVATALSRGAASKAFSAFARIGDTYWTGSPYEANIEVYSLNGQHLATLGDQVARHPDHVIQPEDLVDWSKAANPRQFIQDHLLKKSANQTIVPYKDWVFVQMDRFMDIYDRHGNLLQQNLAAHTWLRYGDGQHLVSIVPAGYEPQNIPDKELKTALTEAGYHADDNPCLVLYRLRSTPDLG